MNLFIFYILGTSAFAAGISVESLIKVKNFPEPRSLSESAGFHKVQNGHIQRNTDVYGPDSWVIDIPIRANSDLADDRKNSIHVECVVNPSGYCETTSIKNSTTTKPGIPYIYNNGKDQYLIVAGRGREDGEEFISVLTKTFKELCKVHVLNSYSDGSPLSALLKNPARQLKWNGPSCEFAPFGKTQEL